MNTRLRTMDEASQAQLLCHALEGLRESTGITASILPREYGTDAAIQLRVAGKFLRYECEVKSKVDRFLTLEDLKARKFARDKTLLVCPALTSSLAMRCHELGIQFIDTAGNAYIDDGEGILINVMGRKLSPELSAPTETTVTPAALRMIFAFLSEPAMLNAPYREISMAVHVSTGAIAKAYEMLEMRGYIGTTPNGVRLIRSPELLLSEWATGYSQRLRPKLKKFRFTSPHPEKLWTKWAPEFGKSAWGGEVAAELITKHLNPSSCTIYMDMEDPADLSDLVKQFRLRADPQGEIEVLQAFWSMDRFSELFPSVPFHLVYADLLGTKDPRNLQIAQQIFKSVINHVHRSQR